MSLAHPCLTLDAAYDDDGYVLRMEGELDLAGCPDLESALADAERSRAGRIVVDVDGLSSIDARGLEVLLWALRRSARNGNRLHLTRGRGEVARLFRMMMLDVTLPFMESVSTHESGADTARKGPCADRALGESLSAESLRLQEEARLARQRFHTYNASTYGPRFTDPARLFELERGFQMAENRLRPANPDAPHTRPEHVSD
jgi:anti-anti-sigma factor